MSKILLGILEVWIGLYIAKSYASAIECNNKETGYFHLACMVIGALVLIWLLRML